MIFIIEGIDISTLKIESGDTVIITVDPEIIKFEKLVDLWKRIDEFFPNNKVLAVLKGTTIAAAGSEENEDGHKNS